MTHLVPHQFKKDLLKAMQEDSKSVYFQDPSIFDPVSGTAEEILTTTDCFTVTNARRIWFARVFYNEQGQLTVD